MLDTMLAIGIASETRIAEIVARGKRRIDDLTAQALDTIDILACRMPPEARADFLREKRVELEAWRADLHAEIDRVAEEPGAPSHAVH